MAKYFFKKVDERYTTQAAREIMEEIGMEGASRGKFKEIGDGIASMLIMQNFLDYYNK